MYSIGFAIPIILIALASGFWVLARASKEDGGLKDIGKVIGWLIVVVSFIILVVSVYSSFRYYSFSNCYMHDKMMRGRMMQGHHGMMMRHHMPPKEAEEIMEKMMPKESEPEKTK